MFVHLHTHTEYSLLDGMSKIKEIVAAAKAHKQTALAITDHGVMHGALEFYFECQAQDIKPIIGLEAYVAKTSLENKDNSERSPYHLTLLAKNNIGYNNLLKLSSISHLEGFYYRPRIDRSVLEKYSEGIIVLSGCPSGELMTHLQNEQEDDVLETIKWYKRVFQENYYIEIQEHEQQQFSRLTPRLIDLANTHNIKIVATNDSHYTTNEQHKFHDLLLCIGTNTTIDDPKRFKLDGDSFYLKSSEEMEKLFEYIPEAIYNTQLIADEVNIQLEFNRTLLPQGTTHEGRSPTEQLEYLCREGLQKRYSAVDKKQTERLKYELKIIEETGFVEYILIVNDIAQYAKEKKIRIGVRGSAAASMILYCLGVTNIEPTQYDLVFERFLNPERKEMPDVDFDFPDDKRDEIIQYTAEKYGHDRVAQIITFGRMGAKASIRDAGRALGMAYDDVDKIAKLIPDVLNISIQQALESAPEMNDLYKNDSKVKELIDNALGIEGIARHASTHAAGIVISAEPLEKIVPLQRPTSTKQSLSSQIVPTTQFAMDDIAKIGLLKMDYLGLANLTVLEKALDFIKETQNIDIDLDNLEDGDPKTIELFAEARTFGIFQMESSGMRSYVKELKPQNIVEIAAMVALYRPGPMEQIPNYIDVKHRRSTTKYLHADLAPILDETYGVITYQDQVLQIVRIFAGYSLGQADVMRKAMGKKIPEVMAAEKERFISGALEKGYDEKISEEIFNLIEPFAGYAFNKAHAFSYATIAYQTAYLKAHFPVEFMAAVLCTSGNSLGNNQDKISPTLAECRKIGIDILPPDINKSKSNFSIEKNSRENSSIRFGLSRIKNVGSATAEQIVLERQSNKDYTSLEDFSRRSSTKVINKRVIESLAKCGAFDCLADRNVVVDSTEQIISLNHAERKLKDTGQKSMFDLFGDEQIMPLPELELNRSNYTKDQFGAWEKDLTGFYFTEHPFLKASENISSFLSTDIVNINESLSNSNQRVAGVLKKVDFRTTKYNKRFAIFELEDLTESKEFVIWPEKLQKFEPLLVPGNVLMVEILIQNRNRGLSLQTNGIYAYDRESQKIVGFEEKDLKKIQPVKKNVSKNADSNNNKIHSLNNLDSKSFKNEGLNIYIDETNDIQSDKRRLSRIFNLIDDKSGNTPVYLHINSIDGKKQSLFLSNVSVDEHLIRDIKILLGVLGEIIYEKDSVSSASAI
ncbi:MAG: DNA polymerase III subunit alpha [Dehalococcoidaceae bacterium]|nr:DNA polymerase III subunit alpha [Dehalococcoidaceae bacterium]